MNNDDDSKVDDSEVLRRPLFLRASDPSTWDKPEDISWGDYSLSDDPEKPLNSRQKEVARLLFLGKSQTEVAERVGYTVPWVNRLAGNSKVRAEIERMQDRAFDQTVGERLKDIGPQSMSVIEEGIRGTGLKMRDRVELAKWIVEKLDGKASQKLDVSSSTLDRFMQVVAELKQTEELPEARRAEGAEGRRPEGAESPSAQTHPTQQLDSTAAPAKPEEADWSDWLDSEGL